MQPIILVTLYRRYFELVDTINNIQRLKGEFKLAPIIVIVWADPEPDKYGLMEQFLKEGKAHYILERKKSEYDGWNKPTTPAELLQFEMGFNFIKEKFKGQDYYIVVNGADILVSDGIYGLVDKEIQTHSAVLFFWFNGIATMDAWHTNFFAVKDQRYLPKYEEKYAVDTLETMWGKRLVDENLRDFFKSHNSREMKFKHIHDSTHTTLFPSNNGSGVFVFKNGIFVENTYLKVKAFFIKGLKWLKSLFHTTQ